MESSPKLSVEIYVLMKVLKTYACLIGRRQNLPSHILYLYIFKNVQQTHIKILLEMKSAQTAQRIQKVPSEKVDVCVTITIIAFKDIIIHSHVTVSVRVRQLLAIYIQGVSKKVDKYEITLCFAKRLNVRCFVLK